MSPDVSLTFRSFLQAGFECSTQRRTDGTRLDLLASSGHDRFAHADFLRLHPLGIETVRSATRWHLIEPTRNHFDFSSLLLYLDAARSAGIELLLDLLHFGWPDHIDIFDPKTSDRFATYVRETCLVLSQYPDVVTTVAVINEISFLAWAGGEVAALNPGLTGQGNQLKFALLRMAIAGSQVVLREFPHLRLITPEPVIHVHSRTTDPSETADCKAYTHARYQSWDMLSGRQHPELGGQPEYLGVMGVNYYPGNQWINHSGRLSRHDPRYIAFSALLGEVYERYRRPLFVAETGTEGDDRASWFHYVFDQVSEARQSGIPIEGICLYPILNHPGWDDDRHCCNGLFDYCDASGHREIHRPLAMAIRERNNV